MKRLFNSILFRQLTILITATLLSQFISIGIILISGKSVSASLHRSRIFEQIAATVKILNSYPQQNWDMIVTKQSNHDLCYNISNTAEVTENKRLILLFNRNAINEITKNANYKPNISLIKYPDKACQKYDYDYDYDDEHEEKKKRKHHKGKIGGILVSVKLDNNKWLNANAILYFPKSIELVPFVTLIPMILLVIILSNLMMRNEVKGIKLLSEAVNDFGNGRNIMDMNLKEQGSYEVRNLIHSFKNMTKRINKFVSERTLLLASVSHDLRTPLTSLRINAEMIEDELIRREMTKTIEYMGELIDSTIEFAKFDVKKEHFRTIEVNSLIESIVEDYNNNNCQFNDTAMIKLQCRPNSIKRALANLIDNAIKYGQTCNIQIENINKVIRIIIADNGPGIPDDMLEEVKKPFFRVESSRNPITGGTGLGISIANDIILSHGGKLEFKNYENGLMTIIELPLN